MEVLLLLFLRSLVVSVGKPLNPYTLATSITGRQVDPLEFAQVLSNCDDENIHSDTIVLSFGCFADGHSTPAYVRSLFFYIPANL